MAQCRNLLDINKESPSSTLAGGGKHIAAAAVQAHNLFLTESHNNSNDYQNLSI